MIKDQNSKDTTSDDNLIEVPGYGIGVSPEELYKPDLPQKKCPNGNSFAKKRTLIRKSVKNVEGDKSKNKDIAPDTEADAIAGE